MSSQTLTGYYRYTDIWFDWHARIDPEDGRALKALLAHDALVHPNHPLHVEGVDGAQLYIGHFDSGEARLLFSSAQVDYIRYWLQATGMTKETVPLPWSDCLLTTADLKAVEPVVYKDGGSVRNAIKVLLFALNRSTRVKPSDQMIEKNNKRLKGNNPTLAHSRHIFERVRALYTGQNGAWCAMDFEDWEYDHKVNTEFGFRMVAWKGGEKIERQGHWIVEEAKHYRNGRYVKDNRDHYQFGQSEFVKRVEWKKRICDLIEELHSYGPVYLVFHDYTQDIRTLTTLGAPLDGISYILPDSTPSKGLFVVDTAYLLAALLGEQAKNRKGLEQMSHMLKQNPAYLHNAGNDAHYTFGCFLEMASGEQIDLQRERRWPNQTAGGSLWVKIKPEQEGREDDSDDEMDVAPKLGYDPVTGKLYRTDMLDSDSDEA